jgi:hypothetical protein
MRGGHWGLDSANRRTLLQILSFVVACPCENPIKIRPDVMWRRFPYSERTLIQRHSFLYAENIKAAEEEDDEVDDDDSDGYEVEELGEDGEDGEVHPVSLSSMPSQVSSRFKALKLFENPNF